METPSACERCDSQRCSTLSNCTAALQVQAVGKHDAVPQAQRRRLERRLQADVAHRRRRHRQLAQQLVQAAHLWRWGARRVSKCILPSAVRFQCALMRARRGGRTARMMVPSNKSQFFSSSLNSHPLLCAHKHAQT